MSAALVLAAALALLGPAGIPASTTPRSPTSPIDGFVTAWMRANRVPGLSLAITHGDDVVHLRGYGQAGQDRPVTPDTPFFLASLSKSFTAVSVLQLVEAGRVELDAPVERYVPGFTVADRAAGRHITVRHLLNHTSGMADAGFPDVRLPQPESIEEAVAALRDARTVSRPGTQFHYFERNYAVLARLVEAVTGRPFGDHLREHVLAPLAMTHSTAVVGSTEARGVAPDLAQGHVLAFGVPVPRDELDGYVGGSAGVLSTARDIANWLVVQQNDGRFGGRSLLGARWLRLTHTPPPGVAGSYAMGWTLDPGPPAVLSHTGVLSTFHAAQVLLPDSGYAFAVLAGTNHALTGWADLERGLIRHLTAGEVPEPGFGVGDLGVLLAALVIPVAAVGLTGVRRSPGWARRHGRRRWRAGLGIGWPLLPTVLALSTSSLVDRFSGRVFGWYRLVLAMPDVIAVLGVSGMAGLAVALSRAVALTRVRRAT
ncbi:serine hydrolase domain-containing protein [Geodermatophilus maliterrae]|uniref:Serine hydrolase domain-containing protein n=1 Tax=Geodermatophilus maliterrae TaxID=3162531 RepID=A0ABV3XIL9_9ACTN